MSRLYNKIREYYNLGMYTKAHLKVFVSKNTITPEEYYSITGESYN